MKKASYPLTVTFRNGESMHITGKSVKQTGSIIERLDGIPFDPPIETIKIRIDRKELPEWLKQPLQVKKQEGWLVDLEDDEDTLDLIDDEV